MNFISKNFDENFCLPCFNGMKELSGTIIPSQEIIPSLCSRHDLQDCSGSIQKHNPTIFWGLARVPFISLVAAPAGAMIGLALVVGSVVMVALGLLAFVFSGFGVFTPQWVYDLLSNGGIGLGIGIVGTLGFLVVMPIVAHTYGFYLSGKALAQDGAIC